jgi:hypothetical protein
MHFSSPSQTSATGTLAKPSLPGLPGLPRRKPGSGSSSADKRVDPGLGAGLGGAPAGGTSRIVSGLSPLNPRRVGSGAAAALVAAGGAVASMQGALSGVARPMSPPNAGMPRKRGFPVVGTGRRYGA